MWWSRNLEFQISDFRRGRRRGAALLVESAIALAIVMTGIAVAVLLLDGSTRAIAQSAAETEIVNFADGVLGGLRASSATAAQGRAWLAFWEDVQRGAAVPLPAAGMWAGATSLVVRAGPPSSVVFGAYGHHAVTNLGFADHAVGYQLAVDPDPLDADARRVDVTLVVWGGGITGGVPASATATGTFHTSYWDTGGL